MGCAGQHDLPIRRAIRMIPWGLVCFCSGCVIVMLWAAESHRPYSSASEPPSLHESARTGDVAAMKVALAAGAEVNRREDGSRLTPLLVAARAGQLAAVQLLLESGADARASTNTHGNALGEAAFGGNVEIVAILLDRAECPDDRFHKGHTPLMLAALKGDRAVTRLLIKAGADVNARGTAGETPLITAVCSGDQKLVGELLDAGANCEATNDRGQNAMAVARELEYGTIIDLLLAHANRPSAVRTNLQRETRKTLATRSSAMDVEDGPH